MSYFADLEIRQAEAEWEAGWQKRQIEYAKADAAERQKETDMETTTANHPVYTRVSSLPPRYPHRRLPDGRCGEDTSQSPLSQRITTAEVAKLLRQRLKQEFPGTKFSVRSDCCSGGSSIDVSWQGHPSREAVEKLTWIYAFADFDGMTDMKTYHNRYLSPDGSLSAHQTDGAILVRGGADYVFTRRQEL